MDSNTTHSLHSICFAPSFSQPSQLCSAIFGWLRESKNTRAKNGKKKNREQTFFVSEMVGGLAMEPSTHEEGQTAIALALSWPL